MAAVGLLLLTAACGRAEEQFGSEGDTLSWQEMVFDDVVPLEYAENFSIAKTEEGYALISIDEEGDYLVVPEDRQVPVDVPADTAVIRQPVEQAYLAATSTMAYFCAMDGLDALAFSGVAADGWYLEEAKEAMEEGRLVFGGKYNSPDYERLVAEGCPLAIMSTMIYHTPEVKENLEDLGIPVLVDRSSYESHPLGRTEWVKVYGTLLGKEELAEELFSEQTARLAEIPEEADTGKKVGFFYISSRGYANVRRTGDYVSKMIELAGGEYLFPDLGGGDNALSTINLQMEEFYAAAREADVLIYNSASGQPLTSVEELLTLCPLLADSKAVQNGDVWCTAENMFQSTMNHGDMIGEFRAAILGEDDAGLEYLYKLQ